MVSRRDAVMLGTAALLAPFLGLRWSGSALATPAGVALNSRRTTAAQAPLGPRLDAPIVVQWQQATSATVRMPPVIAAEVVVLVDADGLMQAFDLTTGAERWSTPIAYPYVAAPATAESMVFVASVGQEGATIQAFAAETGDELWRADRDEGPAQSQSTIDAGSGAVFTQSGRDLLQLDAATGDELARWPDASAPTVVDDTLFVRGISPSGMELIAYDLTSGAQRWAIPFSGSPYVRNEVALGDGRAYVTSGDNILHALDAATGEEIWQFARGDMTGTAARFANGLVFADSTDGLVALDAETGTVRWSDPSVTIPNAKAAAGDMLYVASSGFAALDTKTGEVAWQYAIGDTVALADGLVILTSDTTVIALGNLPPSTVVRATSLRDSPSALGIDLGTVAVGAEVYSLGWQENEGATTWLQITAAGTTGWLPLDAIDPATLPDGTLEYVYIPE